MAVQTIRRKVDPDTYLSLASGDQSFVICTPHEDVQPDDYFVFVEELDGKPNREIYRKISIVVEIEETDIVIAGLVPVEYQALTSLFAQNNSLVAYGIERRGDETTILSGPVLIPIMVAPGINIYQANDFLGTDVWPDGQYSIQLKCHMTPVEQGQQDVTITETLIMCRTQRQHQDEDIDLFLEVDHRYLLAGKLKDIFGNQVVPHFDKFDIGEQDDDFIIPDEIVSDEDYETTLGGAEETSTPE